MGAGTFSPRLGLAYRATDKLVIRGGYGINYDPYPLAFVRDLLATIRLASSERDLTEPFQFAGRLADGNPRRSGARHQQRHHSSTGAIGARTLDPKRSALHPLVDVTVQKDLPLGFTGQVGYVGTRQRDIIKILNLNAEQVIVRAMPAVRTSRAIRRTAKPAC